jgi:hypothetical protein
MKLFYDHFNKIIKSGLFYGVLVLDRGLKTGKYIFQNLNLVGRSVVTWLTYLEGNIHNLT